MLTLYTDYADSITLCYADDQATSLCWPDWEIGVHKNNCCKCISMERAKTTVDLPKRVIIGERSRSFSLRNHPLVESDITNKNAEEKKRTLEKLKSGCDSRTTDKGYVRHEVPQCNAADQLEVKEENTQAETKSKDVFKEPLKKTSPPLKIIPGCLEGSSRMEQSQFAWNPEEGIERWPDFPYSKSLKDLNLNISGLDTEDDKHEDYFIYLNGCSPEPKFSPNMKSPHEAPFAAPSPKKEIRSEVIDNYNSSIFPNPDGFINRMEERLIHWRPRDSQHNAEQSLDGIHPYQAHNFEDSKGLWETICEWFSRPKAASKPSNNLATTSPQEGYRTPTTADILRVFNKLHLKANTHDSITNTPSPALTGSTIAAVLLTTGPPYARTPQALSYPEYQLNYSKREEPAVQNEEPAFIDTIDQFCMGFADSLSCFLTPCWNDIE